MLLGLVQRRLGDDLSIDQLFQSEIFTFSEGDIGFGDFDTRLQVQDLLLETLDLRLGLFNLDGAALHRQLVGSRVDLDQPGSPDDKTALFKGRVGGGNLTADFCDQQQFVTRLNGPISLDKHLHFFGPGRKYFDQAAGVLDNAPFGFGPQDNQDRRNDNRDQDYGKDSNGLKSGSFFHRTPFC